MAQLELTYETDDGEEVTFTVPAKNAVCDDCEGEGSVLCEGMRGHAYSAEEFAESFDDEERAEYFKRGGRYDIPCPTCKGLRVVPVVDEERLAPDARVKLAVWEKREADKREIEREMEAISRMERMMGA